MTKEEPTKLTWKQRFALKRIIKHGIKNIKKKRRLKQEQKTAEQQEQIKQETITALLELSEVFDLYQDEQKTKPITEQYLQEQTIDYLLDYLEELLNHTKTLT